MKEDEYMPNLTSKAAFKLLTEGIINTEEDWQKQENRWILHCYYAGEAAARIATKLGFDEKNADYAKTLGYIHDIGRRINHKNHPREGYKYLQEKGYKEASKVCLTHSFIDNDINLVAGGPPKKKENYDFFVDFLTTTELTIFDNIVQLCDLFCLETGFTTIEKRLLDIYTRKGIYPNTQDHLNATINLKKRLEEKMHCELYDLFPEIEKSVLESQEKDNKELLKMINNNTNKTFKKTI